MTYSKFKVFKSKDQGGRDSQQDDYYSEYNEALDKLIMVVADGMGGHKGGQIASEIAVKKTKQFFHDKSNENLSAHEFFKKLIPSIHKSIFKRGLKDNISPHTTIVIAIIQNGYIEYAHIGDSRLYIFTEEEQLVERTRDHSVPEMLFQMGEISENEMATHPDQNKLTKSLGGERVESFSFKRHKMDRSKNYAIVLCSDGLWEYFTDAQMYKALFKMNLTLDDIGNKMIARAKNIGGQNGDNITLVFTKIPATRQAFNPFNILSKVQLVIVGIVSILLVIGFILFISEEETILKETNSSSEKEKKIEQILKPITSNQVVKTTRVPLPKWKNVHSIIIKFKKDLTNKKSIEEKVEAYSDFFDKYGNKFDVVLKKKNDSTRTKSYKNDLENARNKSFDEDYNSSESLYSNALDAIQKLTEKEVKIK